MERFKNFSTAMQISLAALLVNGLRFVILFLAADALKLPWLVEGIMLGITGIASGIVLTGGGAYIAHEIVAMRGQVFSRLFMVVCWIILLVSNVILLAPMMAVGLAKTEFTVVLDANQRWLWAVTAIVAIEVLAAGAMVAHAAGQHSNADESIKKDSKPSNFSLIIDALAQRIVYWLRPQPAAVVAMQPATVAIPSVAVQMPEAQTVSSIEIATAAMEAYQMQQEGMTVAEIAEKLQKSPRTISNYLRDAKAALPTIAPVHTNGFHTAQEA